MKRKKGKKIEWIWISNKNNKVEPNISGTHTHNNTIKNGEAPEEEEEKRQHSPTNDQTYVRRSFGVLLFEYHRHLFLTTIRLRTKPPNPNQQRNAEGATDTYPRILCIHTHFLSISLPLSLPSTFDRVVTFVSLVEPQLNAFTVTCLIAERMYDSFEEFYLKRYFHGENPIVLLCSAHIHTVCEIEKVHPNVLNSPFRFARTHTHTENPIVFNLFHFQFEIVNL